MKHIISFEDGQLIYLCGTALGKRISVKSWAKHEMTAGVLDNGLIMDVPQFARELQEFAQEQKIAKNKISAVISSHDVIGRELTLPLAKEKEFATIVANELLYTLGGAEDYTTEYMVLEENKKEKQRRILGLALRSSAIKDYREAFDLAGLKLGSIDVGQNCVGKLVWATRQGNGVRLAMAINPGSVDLYMLENSFCILSRNVRLRYRTFLEDGTLDVMAAELAQHIERMLHYQRVHHSEEVSDLIVIGNMENKAEFLKVLEENAHLTCSFLTAGNTIRENGCASLDLDTCVRALGALAERT